jgi:hypothetical protein
VVEALELIGALETGVFADSEFDSELKRDESKLPLVDVAGVKGTQPSELLRNDWTSSQRSFSAQPSKVVRVEVLDSLKTDSISEADYTART